MTTQTQQDGETVKGQIEHTPGPWEVNGYEVQAKNKHETFIAEVFPENGSARANARLIAQAPART